MVSIYNSARTQYSTQYCSILHLSQPSKISLPNCVHAKTVYIKTAFLWLLWAGELEMLYNIRLNEQRYRELKSLSYHHAVNCNSNPGQTTSIQILYCNWNSVNNKIIIKVICTMNLILEQSNSKGSDDRLYGKSAKSSYSI